MKATRFRDSAYRKWLEIRRPDTSEYSGVDDAGYYFVHDEHTGSPVFVSHQRRLAYYRNGVEARVSNLAREYCVDNLSLTSSDQVVVERLDDVVNRNFPSGRIAVLKVEAEGFEPEVLRGADQTLQRTDVVTVDAGEEREGKSTAPECVNILLKAGFELRQVFLRRGVFLFESVKKP